MFWCIMNQIDWPKITKCSFNLFGLQLQSKCNSILSNMSTSDVSLSIKKVNWLHCYLINVILYDKKFSIGQMLRKLNCHMLPFLTSEKNYSTYLFQFHFLNCLITCHKYLCIELNNTSWKLSGCVKCIFVIIRKKC